MADELVGTGIPVSQLRIVGGAALDLSRLPTRFPYLLVTPQYQTERVLKDRATLLGADIRYDSKVTGFTSHQDVVEIRAALARCRGEAADGAASSYPLTLG